MKIQIHIQTVKLIKRFLLMLVDTGVIGVGEMNEIISQLRFLAEKSEYKPDLTPKLIDQKEAAEMLGISYANFKKMEKNGLFPFKRKMVGTSVRYRNTEVIEYIRN